MRLRISSVLCGILLLAGCGQQSAQAEYQGGGGGTIEAINHTKWAINQFSVNGQSGLDVIGPYQGGGGRLLLRRAETVAAGNDDQG